jgi:hypothetical protein
MANTYSWVVSYLDCIPKNGAKVVYCVHWRLKGSDGVNHAEVYGTEIIENNEKNAFISYEELTEKEVINWLQSSMGSEKVESLQTSLDNQINNLANPPTISLPLPWENK